MTGFKRAFPFLLYLIPFAAMAFVQSTAIILPTSDDTSAFVVEDADNNPVFSAAGDGDVAVSGDAAVDGELSAQMLSTTGNAVIGGSATAASFHGDGSTLSNVQTRIASIEGNQRRLLNDDFQIVRTVTITAPEDGVIHVTATGTVDWESTGTDFFLGSILPTSSNPEISYSAETEFWRNVCIMSDHACADSSDQYSAFATSRSFNVSAGGTYSYSLWANDGSYAYSNSRAVVHDTNMTAMYFPSGSIVISNESYRPALGGDGQAIEPRQSSLLLD